MAIASCKFPALLYASVMARTTSKCHGMLIVLAASTLATASAEATVCAIIIGSGGLRSICSPQPVELSLPTTRCYWLMDGLGDSGVAVSDCSFLLCKARAVSSISRSLTARSLCRRSYSSSVPTHLSTGLPEDHCSPSVTSKRVCEKP